MKISLPYKPAQAPNSPYPKGAAGGAMLKALRGFGAGKGSILETAAKSYDSDLPSDLEGACRAMEQQFMELVLDSMRKAFIPASSKGSDGFSKDMSMSMLEGEVAKLSSQNEGMGLWKLMYDQLDPKVNGVKSEKDSAEKTDGGIVRKMGHIIG